MLIIIIFIASVPQGYFSESGSIRIQVWGEIRTPGIYMVPPSTNLLEAISFAGGPISRSDLSRVKLVRVIKEKKVFYFNVGKYLSGEKKDPPILDSGDLIYVPQSFSSRVWDFVRFMGIVAGAVYAIYRVTE